MSEPNPPAVIRLRGVRHNNLKNFDLDLPLHRLIVITGLSGSGKSSLAFDTLYAEGQRRYIETFSPYARQFFDRMDKPQVDSIEGIPPAIAIEQRNAVRSTRSTVGTMTEICDHMKVLWPHLAQLHCRGCGQPVRKDSPQSVWETLHGASVLASLRGTRKEAARQCLAPPRIPHHIRPAALGQAPARRIVGLISKQGYQRLLVKNEVMIRRLRPIIPHSHSALRTHRDSRSPQTRARRPRAFRRSLRTSLPLRQRQADRLGNPSSILHPPSSRLFSNRLHCAACDLEYSDPSPALFSFNHPLGACPTCKGFGRTITIDYDLAIPDRSLTLAQGAVKPWRTGISAECQSRLEKVLQSPPRPDGRAVPRNFPPSTNAGSSKATRITALTKTSMAARLVWRERLFPLAGNQVLQNARPRAALPLPRLHEVPDMPGRAAEAGGVAVPSSRSRGRQSAQINLPGVSAD
jgi:excinuclease ABC subunit A